MSIDPSDVERSAGCLSRDDLEKYLNSDPEGRSRVEVQEHLSRCFECRARLTRGLDEAWDDENYDEVASDELPAAILAQVRALPFEASVDSGPKRQRFALAAALILAVIGFGLWWRVPETLDEMGVVPESRRETLRSGIEASEVVLESPTPGARATLGELELRWQAVDGADRYTVQLLGPLGQILLKEDTREPKLRPALESFELCSAEQGPCFWFVTVHRKNGSSSDSQIRELWILGDGSPEER